MLLIFDMGELSKMQYIYRKLMVIVAITDRIHNIYHNVAHSP